MAAIRAAAARMRHPSRTARRVAVVAVIVLLVMIAFPQRAYAFDIFDIETSFKKWLLGAACDNFNAYNGLVGQVADKTILTKSFEQFFGGDAYDLVRTIHSTAVVPVAESILALFMLLQLVKISQRIDATATLPAVKDIVFLAVTCVLLHWLIVNSLDVMRGIYDIAKKDIIPTIVGDAKASTFFDGAMSIDGIDDKVWETVGVGQCVLTLITSLLSFLGAMVAYIVTIIVVYARAWQIYAMAAFSAIPLVLLGFDETRQMGIGFLRNFAAVCLAGAVMMFLFALYPHVLEKMVAARSGGEADVFFLTVAGQAASDGNVSGAASAAAAGISIGALTTLFKWLATTALFVLALVKSGAWAREIFGG